MFTDTVDGEQLSAARFVVDQRVVDQPFNRPPRCAHVAEGVPGCQ
ncbi:hypothetical protein [Micromonospora sp. NPDC003776]